MPRVVGLVLLPIGSFAMAIGAVDALGASLIEYRILGLILFLGGALLGAGALAALLFTKNGLVLALIASMAAPLVGLNLVAAQLAGQQSDARVFLWLALLIAPVPGLVALLRLGVRASLPRQIGAVLSVGVIVSVLQFWYTAQYVPSSIAPSLSITLGLDRVGESADETALAATVSVKNASETKVRIVGSMYRVLAVRKCFTTEISDEKGFGVELIRATLQGGPASRIAQDRAVDVVMSERNVLIPEGGWFDPGQEASRRFTAFVPRGKYDVVRMDIVFLFGRGDRLAFDEGDLLFGPRTGVQDGQTYIEQGWRLNEPSVVARLTRAELRVGNFVFGTNRILVTRWYISGDGKGKLPYPELIAYLDTENRHSLGVSPDAYNIDLARYYGLFYAPSSTEVSLWPATSPQATATPPPRTSSSSPIGRGGGCP